MRVANLILRILSVAMLVALPVSAALDTPTPFLVAMIVWFAWFASGLVILPWFDR